VNETPPSPPDGTTLADVDALSRALRDTGWILALYPTVDGIGSPKLVREGIREGSRPVSR
jgi:hypothetical protein